jgi:hypothetical protein
MIQGFYRQPMRPIHQTRRHFGRRGTASWIVLLLKISPQSKNVRAKMVLT